MILYFRMIFQMAVYLYTSRVVIEALGLVDYGIYDVVGSVVLAMMFFNNSMLNCTQRFITCSLAENGGVNVKKIFSHSIFIHFAFGVLIFVLGELLGTWYIQNFMDLPVGRVGDALFVFHMALVSSFIMTVSVPYNALIIAHEHMGAFAAITIVDVLLKLSVALSLFLFDDNRLRMYALLLLWQLLWCVPYMVYIAILHIGTSGWNTGLKRAPSSRCWDLSAGTQSVIWR